MDRTTPKKVPKKGVPKKGILKKTKSSTSAPDTTTTTDAEARAKATQTALQHAKIIQNKKRFESHVLDCLIRLSELPEARGPLYSADNPAESDVAEFKSLIRTFQPTDFDDLVAERNTQGLCGYGLCGKPRQTFPGGQWKIHNNTIIKKAELERWCSQECARRAIYVRVQLDETAAWERVGISTIQIDLMHEKAGIKTDEQVLESQLASLALDDKRQQTHQSETLATERGNPVTVVASEVEVTIREKVVTTAPQPPSLTAHPDDDPDNTDRSEVHTLIEGQRVKLQARGLGSKLP